MYFYIDGGLSSKVVIGENTGNKKERKNIGLQMFNILSEKKKDTFKVFWTYFTGKGYIIMKRSDYI